MASVSGDIAKAGRVVVKIGSAILVDADSGQLRDDWLAGLAKDIADLRDRGAEVVIVSSGSIALGRRVLGLSGGALSLEESQAAAAVGQIRLARAYEAAMAPHNLTTAQMLLTLEDTENRRRYLNSRATLHALLSMGVVPIVNENDSVATDEIRYGDNDRLAARVAVMAGADLCVLLSDVDGLYTANPMTDPAAAHIPVVDAITPDIEGAAGESANAFAKGGMITKLQAARAATGAGVALVITKGTQTRPLDALAKGARATRFLPHGDAQAARKAWIAGMKPRGSVTIDAGAARALGQGRSLLAAGVTRVDGEFLRGDPVDILDTNGQALARGLAGYAAAEARIIAGHRSTDIEGLLGYPGRAALIHRDDLVL